MVSAGLGRAGGGCAARCCSVLVCGSLQHTDKCLCYTLVRRCMLNLSAAHCRPHTNYSCAAVCCTLPLCCTLSISLLHNYCKLPHCGTAIVPVLHTEYINFATRVFLCCCCAAHGMPLCCSQVISVLRFAAHSLYNTTLCCPVLYCAVPRCAVLTMRGVGCLPVLTVRVPSRLHVRHVLYSA